MTRFVKGSLSEMWISFERLNNGGNHHEEPETNNGRLLMSVYGLFSLLIVSLYTAKLAAIIVIQDSSAGRQWPVSRRPKRARRAGDNVQW